jgi:cytochrome c-type biogenesis protein CcmH
MSVISISRGLLLLLFLTASPLSWSAPIDGFKFEIQAQEDRYKRLIEEIRCVKCQNTSIAGSNASIARDHRLKVYQMLLQGKSDSEIRSWFVARYGDFALYRPQVSPRTWLLWALPLLLLVAGGVVLILQIRRQRMSEIETV